MVEEEHKLHQDAILLETMVADMAAYLTSEVLFWPLGDRPPLTLGAYLMRRQRLHALRDQLAITDQHLVANVEVTFQRALLERVVRTENKGVREMEARLRQWREYLQDLSQSDRPLVTNFATSVEPRMMLAALFDFLGQPPYRLDPETVRRAHGLDQQLRRRWQVGDFVLSDGWQEAYPAGRYWWLYGQPLAS